MWDIEKWNFPFLTDSAKSLSPLFFSPFRSPSNFPGIAHTTPHLTKLLMKFHIILASGIKTFFTPNCKNNVSIHPSFLKTEKAYSILWMIPVWKDKKGKAVITLLLCCHWTFHEFQSFRPVMYCSSWDFSPAQEGTVCAICILYI